MDDRRRSAGSRDEANDPGVFLDALDELVIELSENDIEVIEQTLVRDIPRPPCR